MAHSVRCCVDDDVGEAGDDDDKLPEVTAVDLLLALVLVVNCSRRKLFCMVLS